MDDPGTWIWTPAQRRGLAVVTGVLIVVFAIRCRLNPAYLPDPLPPAGARAAELADRLDPNTADAPALSALPLVGEKRSAEIVAYRRRYQSTHPGRPAFATLRDLENVRGIGPATVEKLTPFLTFPGGGSPQMKTDEHR